MIKLVYYFIIRTHPGHFNSTLPISSMIRSHLGYFIVSVLLFTLSCENCEHFWTLLLFNTYYKCVVVSLEVIFYTYSIATGTSHNTLVYVVRFILCNMDKELLVKADMPKIIKIGALEVAFSASEWSKLVKITFVSAIYAYS